MTRGGALIEFIGQSGPPGGGAGVSGVTMVTLMVTQHRGSLGHLPRGHPHPPGLHYSDLFRGYELKTIDY